MRHHGPLARPLRYAVMTGLASIYAICFAAIKAGLVYAPPFLFASLRAFLAGGVLLGLLAILRRQVLPTRASWPWVLALGLTTTTLAFAGMFLSPGRTGAGIASVLGNTQPIVALVLAAVILHERLDRTKVFALGAGALGVFLIAYPELSGQSAYGISGPALALGASLALAVGSIVAKRMGDQVDLINVTAWQLLVGGVPLLALSALFDPGKASCGTRASLACSRCSAWPARLCPRQSGTGCCAVTRSGACLSSSIWFRPPDSSSAHWLLENRSRRSRSLVWRWLCSPAWSRACDPPWKRRVTCGRPVGRARPSPLIPRRPVLGTDHSCNRCRSPHRGFREYGRACPIR